MKKILFLISFLFLLAPGLALAAPSPNNSCTATEASNNRIICTIQSGVFKEVFDFTLSIVNVATIGILIFAALATILRWNVDTYAIKKTLPALVLGVILANFSLLISKIVIEASNVLFITFTQGDANKLFGYLSLDNKIGNLMAEPDIGASEIWETVAGQILVLIAGIMVFILGVLLFIRNYVIYFLVGLAPLAFFAMGIPMLQKGFQMWWGQFWRWVLMAPIAVFWLVIGVKFVDGAQKVLIEVPETTTFNLGAYFLMLAAVYLALRTPFMLGGAIMTGWGKLLGGVAKLTGKPAGTFVKRAGMAIAAKTKETKLGEQYAHLAVGGKLWEEESTKRRERVENMDYLDRENKVKQKLIQNPDYKTTTKDKRIQAKAREIWADFSKAFEYTDVEGIKELIAKSGDKKLITPEEKMSDAIIRFTRGKLEPSDSEVVGASIIALRRHARSPRSTDRDEAQKFLDSSNEEIKRAKLNYDLGRHDIAGYGIQLVERATAPAFQQSLRNLNAAINTAANGNPFAFPLPLPVKLTSGDRRALEEGGSDALNAAENQFSQDNEKLKEQLINLPFSNEDIDSLMEGIQAAGPESSEAVRQIISTRPESEEALTPLINKAKISWLVKERLTSTLAAQNANLDVILPIAARLAPRLQAGSVDLNQIKQDLQNLESQVTADDFQAQAQSKGVVEIVPTLGIKMGPEQLRSSIRNGLKTIDYLSQQEVASVVGQAKQENAAQVAENAIRKYVTAEFKQSRLPTGGQPPAAGGGGQPQTRPTTPTTPAVDEETLSKAPIP